jgi:DNA phosphorothioation-associated putative methyltransferase
MSRYRLSRPAQVAVDLGLVGEQRSVFDFGCGRGGDLARLAEYGVSATGWDPVHRPSEPRRPADVVLCLYVLNVIADTSERGEALREAWALARHVLVVAVRPEWEARQVGGVAHCDGVVTTKGTFQKFFGQDEARVFIEGTIGATAVAIAPGIFFVFRDASEAQGFRAMRVRTAGVRATQSRVELAWAENRELLERLLDFYLSRGRTPVAVDDSALVQELEAAFRSVRAAWRLVNPLADANQLQLAEQKAAEDVLVWLALEAFAGRPRWSELPKDLQLDIKVQHGTFKEACSRADALLFQLGDEAALDHELRFLPFGKVLADAVYVHAEYLSDLPPLVRTYAGCGRALVGEVEDTTILKLSRRERRISYLSYPTFERDAHPALAASLRVDLRSFNVKWTDFRLSLNPPVLHRKELFVPEHHPTRAKFAALTQQEEAAGLLDDHTRIGTREGWSQALAAGRRTLRGHRLGSLPVSTEST